VAFAGAVSGCPCDSSSSESAESATVQFISLGY
jgi:hypothetical protein